MTKQETTARASVQEVLSDEERDILRQYREGAEELGRRLLYRTHYGNVRAIAEDMLGAVLRGEIDSTDGLDERAHEEADAACTYTSANVRTIYASENWDAGPEELGSDLFEGVEDCATLFGRLAFFALRADIRERLALIVGDVEGTAAGIDLDDEDTYPANRTADEDAEEDCAEGLCECEDPGCACGGTCAEDASQTLRRVDMDGAPVRFCEDCAEDALSSGVFGTGDEDDDEEPGDDGPAPGDYVVSSNGFRLSVGIVEGEHVGAFAKDEEAEDAIREHRASTSPDFFPEVWSVSDHGNVSRYAEDGFPWDAPAPEFTDEMREAVEESAARTAFVLTWADAEERDGRTYPGEDLEDVAPDYTPGRFRAWARDMLSAALDATTSGDGIAEAWARAAEEDPKRLGHALALSVGGWTDGLEEQDLPEPVGLPSMDADGRLWVDPADFRADVPTLEDLRRIAAPTAGDVAHRIRTAIDAEEDAEDVLALADKVLGGFGVESIDLPAPDDDTSAGTVRYVNLGDTYTATLAYVEDAYTPGGRFVVADWGSLLEHAEEERTYATGEVRCAYCGDWGCEEHGEDA